MLLEFPRVTSMVVWDVASAIQRTLDVAAASDMVEVEQDDDEERKPAVVQQGAKVAKSAKLKNKGDKDKPSVTRTTEEDLHRIQVYNKAWAGE